jgi:hypothetical protein
MEEKVRVYFTISVTRCKNVGRRRRRNEGSCVFTSFLIPITEERRGEESRD